MKRLRNLVAMIAMAALTLGAGSSAFAQDDANQGRGGRGGGGGRGGMGGGMMGGMRNDNVLFELLRTDEVQAELNIAPEQKDALQKVAEKSRPERPNFDWRNAGEDERTKFFAKMQEDGAKRIAEAKEQLEEILLPGQYERLEQLAVQARGAMGLMHEETAKALAITEEQTAKMKSEMETFAEAARAKMAEAFNGGNREGAREAMQTMRSDAEAKLMAVLTDDQKIKFEAMKGEAFALPEMNQWGGRGGRGPDGQGGGGRRGGAAGRGGARGQDGANGS